MFRFVMKNAVGFTSLFIDRPCWRIASSTFGGGPSACKLGDIPRLLASSFLSLSLPALVQKTVKIS